jgi:hypothetical protein
MFLLLQVSAKLSHTTFEICNFVQRIPEYCMIIFLHNAGDQLQDYHGAINQDTAV